MPRATAMQISTHASVLEWRSVKPMHPSSCFAARLSRSAKGRIPYSREELSQDLTADARVSLVHL
jgi:hypothetical protein